MNKKSVYRNQEKTVVILQMASANIGNAFAILQTASANVGNAFVILQTHFYI